MYTFKRLYLSILVCLSSGFMFAQEVGLAAEKSLTKAQLVEDYRILYKSLTTEHPRPFYYTSASEFNDFFQEQLAAFPEQLTEREFHIFARKLIEKLKCGHTSGLPSEAWYQSVSGKKVSLPFDVKQLGEKVYISNTADQEFDFSIGDELLRINGVDIQDLLNEMISIQQRDGLTLSFAKAYSLLKFRVYYLFLKGVEAQLIVETKSPDGNIVTSSVEHTNQKLKDLPAVAMPDHFKVHVENDWSVFAVDTLSNVGYLKINSFSDRKEFKAHYKEVFQKIEALQCPQIMIDLRDNTGGFFGNGYHFLSYLTPTKFRLNFQRPKRKNEKNEYISMDRISKLTKMAFNTKPSKHKVAGHATTSFTYKPQKLRYQGKINVLTNGITFSMGSLVAAQLKANGAMMYGTETGGTEISTNAILNTKLVLPHSGIRVNIAYYTIISNSKNGEFGFGVKPHVPLYPGMNSTQDEVLLDALESMKAK